MRLLISLVLGKVAGVGDPEENGTKWRQETGAGKRTPEPPVWGPSTLDWQPGLSTLLPATQIRSLSILVVV